MAGAPENEEFIAPSLLSGKMQAKAADKEAHPTQYYALREYHLAKLQHA